MSPALAHLLARLDRWPRRLAALGCLLLAAVSAVAARRSVPAPASGHRTGLRVVVAAHDLGVATTLTNRDLTTVSWPRELVPAGVTAEPQRLVGRRLAGAVRAREAITTARLVGTGLTAGLAPGEVAAAVLTDAGAANLVHPGDRVDVIAGPPDAGAVSSAPGKADAEADVVAEAVAVLAVLPAPDNADDSDAQVLVATDRVTALRIVALQGREVLAVVGDPP